MEVYTLIVYILADVFIGNQSMLDQYTRTKLRSCPDAIHFLSTSCLTPNHPIPGRVQTWNHKHDKLIKQSWIYITWLIYKRNIASVV